MKRTTIFLTALILITALTACSEKTQDSSVSSDNVQSNTSQEQLSVELPENTPTLEDRKGMFLKMANHDKYIMGYVVESFCSDDYSTSYVIMKTLDDKIYRVEGLMWDKYYTRGYFSLSTGITLYSSPLIVGRSIIFFYDEEKELEDGTYFIENPKEFIQMQPPYVRTVADMEKNVQFIQTHAEQLMRNFNAIENPKIFSPEEAMQAVISKFDLKNMTKFIDERGVVVYVNEKYRLEYCTLYFYEPLGMTDEEAEEHAKNIELFGSHYHSISPYAPPYIKYKLQLIELDGDICRTSYLVDITGEIEASD
ncbi:MAG: hypothetical protein RR827_00365 [Oscillospiraceae bacterium]